MPVVIMVMYWLQNCTSIHAGPVVKFSIEPRCDMTKEHITTQDILKCIEEDKTSGNFKRDVWANGPAYQTSKTRPDIIEQVHADGTVILGNFKNSEFIPADKGD